MINIKRQYDQIQRDKIKLLRTLGNNGVKMFKVNNFEAQGFIDQGVSRWKPKEANDGRKTLVKTSVMRNTIFYKVVRGALEFGTLAKYGRRHNEGLDGMPKRQFMGESAALNKINGRSIGLFLKRIMK